MRHLFYSQEFRDIIFFAVMGICMLGFAALFHKRGKYARELRKYCTVPVKALCIGRVRQEGYAFNCTYEFEYEGEKYIANNHIMYSVRDSRYYPDRGESVEVLIDPIDPQRMIYDPLARYAARHSSSAQVFFTVLGVFVMFIPLLQKILHC